MGFDLGGLDSAMNEISGSARQVSRTVNSANRAVNSVNRLTGTASRTLGNSAQSVDVSQLTPQQRAAYQQAAAGGLPMSSTGEYATPPGTCIIIPAQTSLNGQTRYLGKTAYDSVMATLTGEGDCRNVIILDAYGQPSAKYYSQTSDGKFVLNATGKPIEFNMTDDGQFNAIPLSEKEVDAIQRGLRNKGKYKFSQTAQGEAENAENRSWWERNWQWLVAAVVAIIGACVTFFMARKYKKDRKKSQAQSATLSTQVTDLQNKVNTLKKENSTNNNTNNNNNSSNGNTLADNSIKVVGVTDKVIGTDIYQKSIS